jgi:threonine synthase
MLFPTGSYKDRGATVLVSKAKELGVTRVVEDSSGNAGCAIAAYCAKAGMECHIYVPENTSPGKLTQIRAYGARLHRIPGTREDTARATLAAAEGTFYASHVWNPFFFQGTKTFAYEVWEQLDDKAPDAVILPTGNGTLLIGAYLGFRDLLRQNLIPALPRFIAVQAENCAPLLPAFERLHPGTAAPVPTVVNATMAEGIAIAEPRRLQQMIGILNETGGEVVTVTEQEIEEAWVELGRRGFYVEPTSAVVLAAFKKRPSLPGEVVLAPLTGHGLKALH